MRERSAMALFQGRSKRKPTGGRLRPHRSKRRAEIGRELQQTRIGEKRQKFARARGGDRKVRLLRSNYAAVTDPTKGKTARAKILDVIENPANPHYVRQNIITRGAVIETDAGRARVTSRPGQHGVISAVLITD